MGENQWTSTLTHSSRLVMLKWDRLPSKQVFCGPGNQNTKLINKGDPEITNEHLLLLNPTTSFLIPKALWRRRNESLIAPAITVTPSGYVPCGITQGHARDPRSAHNVLQGRTLTRCRVSCVWHETDFKEETSKTVKRSGIFFFESNSWMLKKKTKKKQR